MLKQRRSICTILLLLLNPLYALSYYEYDFRDVNNTTHIRAFASLQSNEIQLNTFEHDWESLPEHKKTNVALGSVYADIYYNFGSFKIGAFTEQAAAITINDGFIQTLYQSNHDFNTFLHLDDINTRIDDTSIFGESNYYKIKGLYFQKVIPLAKKHTLSTKVKLYVADDIQNLRIDGQNTQERFVATLDYYYRLKNYVSGRESNYNTAAGYGYSFDIEYIYNSQKIYLYAGLLNIGGLIFWDGISKMHYQFDSDTVYLGEDGYNHKRAFGIGQYSDNVKYTQQLPMFYRSSVNYTLNENISVGNNMNGYSDTMFNEFYTNIKFNANRYKIGYVYETRTVIFAAYFKNAVLEVSNKFSYSQQLLQAKIHFWF